MPELTITRAALKKIAREAMRGREITKDQRKKLTETAETTEAVVLNGWRLRNCGCLVGASYPELFRADGEWRREFVYDHETNPVGFTGVAFNTLLQAHLNSTGQSFHGDRRAIVKVIDA